MSTSVTLAVGPSPDGNTLENNKKGTVLKDSNNTLSKSRAPKVPAKVPAARIYTPPFCRAVYNHFISSIKFGEPAYPSSKELRKLGFYTTKWTSHRRRFRKLLARFDSTVVNGSLVFSSNLEEDVLVHKKTGKFIVPSEDIEKIVRRAHLLGCNEATDEPLDEASCKHYTVNRTLNTLGKLFTVNRREFGIHKGLVYKYIKRCNFCDLPRAPLERDFEEELFDFEQSKEQIKNNERTTTAPEKLQSVAKMACDDNDAKNDDDKNENEKPPSSVARFCSMVAHVPDKTCIWYDRKSIADATNRFSKLTMVLGEMRGEMGLAVKGDQEAKQRLEAKLYCAQLLIKDHSNGLQHSLMAEQTAVDVFRAQLSSLKMKYEQAGQTGVFTPDITGLLAHVKAHKLALPSLLLQELEDFVNLESDSMETAGGIER